MGLALFFMAKLQTSKLVPNYIVYSLLETITFSCFFIYILKNKLLVKVISTLAIGIVVLGIYSLFDKDVVNFFVNCQNLFFLILSILFFIEKVRFVSKVSYAKTIIFWLVFGIIFSSLGHVFFFLLRGNKEFIEDRLTISAVVVILKNIIFCFGIFYGQPPSKDEDEIIDLDAALKLDDLPESYNKPL
jgi:hypothetical protein